MEISIIVSSYQEQNPWIKKQCLDSLTKISGNNFEIIFVEDGKCSETQKVLEKTSVFYLPRQKDYCVSRSRNAGAAKAKGKYLVFIDSDICLPENAIYIFSEGFEKSDVLFGGIDFRILSSEESLIPDPDYTDFRNTISVTENNIFFKNSPIFEKVNAEVDLSFYQLARLYCWGANLAVKKEIFDKLGGFNENFRGWGFEDVEIGCRIFAGKNIKYAYIDSLKAVHIRDTKTIPNKHYDKELYLRNREILNKTIRGILTRPEGFEPPTF